MHYFESSNGVRFNYNSDMSGLVEIKPGFRNNDTSFEVSGRAVLEFVAEYIRLQRIAEIEGQDVSELLGLQ